MDCCRNGLSVVVVRCRWLRYGFEYDAFEFSYESEQAKLITRSVKELNWET